jgi:hypothetical protein
VEVDTTPSTWLTVEEDAAPFWRPLSDVVSFAWRRLGELRRDMVVSVRPGATAWVIGTLLALLLAWLAFRRAKKAREHGRPNVGIGDPMRDAVSNELRSFHALERELAALGLGRRVTETPRAWIVRASREGESVLGESRIAAARDLIEAIYRNRYGLASAE